LDPEFRKTPGAEDLACGAAAHEQDQNEVAQLGWEKSTAKENVEAMDSPGDLYRSTALSDPMRRRH